MLVGGGPKYFLRTGSHIGMLGCSATWRCSAYIWRNPCKV